MGFFGALVRTAVNVATLPVAVAKDVLNAAEGERIDATKKKLEQIKEEADEEYKE